MRSRDAYYTRQKYLFALVLSLVSIVPLLALNYNASRFYRESWMEKTSLELATLASDRRALIDHFLQTQEDLLAGYLSLYDPQTLTDKARLETLFKAMNLAGVITDLGIIDRKGNHRAYHGPFEDELAGKNYARTEWFDEVMKNGRYVSDVFTGYRKVPHFIVAVAGPNRDWILRATINSELFNSLVASANVGPDGNAFIVNRRGELQTPSRPGLAALKPESLAFFTRLADAGGKAQPKGEFIHCVTHLNGGQWLLVLETNIAASLASYDKARRLDTALVAAAALAIVLVAVFLMRSMVGKLERADRERTLLTNQVGEMEKLALIGRLSASVAHEVNNPLQIISDQAGLMDELMNEERPDAIVHYRDYRQALAKIRTQIGRTSTITHRLLGFSRRQAFEPAETDINLAVEETVALLEHEARRHHIVISRHYQEDLPTVLTDAAQLQQVVLNILHNAMDAIGQDGVIEVASRVEGERLVIDFADSGPGLPEDMMDHLYAPFFTTKPKGEGTGLGLFVSQEVMANLGGKLRAANRPEGGAVFSICLPRQARPVRNAALPERT